MLEQIIASTLEWVIIGMLGAVLAGSKRVVRMLDQTTRACKRLTRSDLVARYKECRDNGFWMSDERKREWLDDYAEYMAMVGQNGYIEDLKRQISEMPTHPED